MHDLDDIRPYLELTAVAAGAVSGALHARRRNFDFVGVVTIGIGAGLGGGLIRDMMLAVGPALALRTPALLTAAVIASLLGSLFGRLVHRLGRPLWFIDSLALGLFAVAGLQRAEAAGLPAVPSLFLGVVTCVGGGLVRDVLCREMPILLLPGPPYAVTALLAGTVYLTALRALGLPDLSAELLAVGAALVLRVGAAWRGWKVPIPPELDAVVPWWRGRAPNAGPAPASGGARAPSSSERSAEPAAEPSIESIDRSTERSTEQPWPNERDPR